MEKINSKEATFLIISICINMSILIAGQTIVEQCGSSSLINACIISILAIIIACIICLLYKKFIGLNILDIANFLGGKVLKAIVGVIFLGYFIYTISVLLCRLADCLQIVYYPMTNIIYIVILFVMATGIVCNIKNNAFSRVNLIIVPISLITLILVFAGNAKNFDYQNIFPVLGNGINNTFIFGITNIFAFAGIAYLYFLPAKLKKPENFLKISLWGIGISAIFLLIVVSIILFMFNSDKIGNQIFPLYLSVRYIEFGTFFQRMDSVYLLIRIISFLAFLGIMCNLCLNIFKSITKAKDEKPIIYPFMLTLLGVTMLIEKFGNVDFLQNTGFKILFISIVLGFGLLILILANIKKKIIK